MRHRNSPRSSSLSVLKLLLMWAATIAVGFGLVSVLVNAISGYEFSQHYSTLATTGFGVAGLGACVALDRGTWRWPMIATVGISVGGIFVGLCGIITGKHYFCEPPMFRLSYVLFPIALISAWLGLLAVVHFSSLVFLEGI